MSWWTVVLILAGVALVLWASLIVGLVIVGRRGDAIAVSRFIPDCVVLFRRLLADDRVPRNRKLALLALVAYLALPFDLVPDFIPIAGQLDDAILVVLTLRYVLRAGGRELLLEHWPGPAESRDLLLRLAFGTR